MSVMTSQELNEDMGQQERAKFNQKVLGGEVAQGSKAL